MGRLNAIFTAFCMVLIAASAGIVSWLAVSFTGMEATVLAIAVMTALVLINSVTSRQRDRFDIGGQIADLSRATGDMGRQVSELDRRLVAMEGEVAAAMDRTRGRIQSGRPFPAADRHAAAAQGALLRGARAAAQ